MARQQYPTYGAVQLPGSRHAAQWLVASRFAPYLQRNPHLETLHKHTFYHLVYFTQGEGEQVIDFEHFPVKKGTLYFMRPGQVHNWHFNGMVDGYVINFYDRFFERAGFPVRLLSQFAFFGNHLASQVIQVSKKRQEEVTALFEQLVAEQEQDSPMQTEMTAALLLQLFILVHRQLPAATPADNGQYNSTILLNFQELIEQHYRQLRLPKQYAAMLYITPNHLNALCKDLTGMAAGEIIRNRVLLEAKRLLVNRDISIASIAAALHFTDDSYFVKFFKKYTGTTPEQFRKQLLKPSFYDTATGSR
ncbi:AraC family transcriptional regulator [Deminuibacter soli]|uniref:Helix-turn-helix domain-containing protein n=1 Tax=Deminuibacter soli TaxID=2291815 RepID=A0A3E1NK80_9BACT|nr:AraC family transcriptional regulator [Deminuibacter soli]RFM28346.1 helix-turn-helix domain-containing protein [Deminuibacter soli]